MQFTEVEINQEVKAMVEIAQVAAIKHANTVGKATAEGTTLHMEKKCQKCGKDNHFKSVCRSNGNDKHDSSQSRPKKGHKGK